MFLPPFLSINGTTPTKINMRFKYDSLTRERESDRPVINILYPQPLTSEIISLIQIIDNMILQTRITSTVTTVNIRNRIQL